MCMEYRIYVDDDLVMCCSGQYALMCNYMNYEKEFGSERVRVEHVPVTMDKEKLQWLQQMYPSDVN